MSSEELACRVQKNREARRRSFGDRFNVMSLHCGSSLISGDEDHLLVVYLLGVRGPTTDHSIYLHRVTAPCVVQRANLSNLHNFCGRVFKIIDLVDIPLVVRRDPVSWTWSMRRFTFKPQKWWVKWKRCDAADDSEWNLCYVLENSVQMIELVICSIRQRIDGKRVIETNDILL